MSVSLSIGEVAARTGVASTTLRYYEKLGLLPAPERIGGRRRYQESVLIRLEVIRLCKAAGFALEEVAVLINDAGPGRPLARALAEAKLLEIAEKMDALERAKDIVRWGMSCTCPSIDACTCGIHHAVPV